MKGVNYGYISYANLKKKISCLIRKSREKLRGMNNCGN